MIPVGINQSLKTLIRVNTKYDVLDATRLATIYDQTIQRYYTQERPAHNALADAQAYRLG